MKNAIRNGALALGLIAGAALVAPPPADARSIQRDGYFGGTWGPIGPRHNHYVERYHRRHGPDISTPIPAPRLLRARLLLGSWLLLRTRIEASASSF